MRTLVLAMAVPAGPAAAQLYGGFVPGARHTPVNVWFGTARDAAGRYVPNATIVLRSRQIDFVAVTDAQGRFRLELPVHLRPVDVQARCSHKSYAGARIARRLPRGAALSPVELTCRLR
ncbi:carboxypeptidase-like regulatory domain-containing protein [Novosphingobium sp. KCTC 2891]|uniref:carboxypeptidase-like regulatory domain-containing protein n=1 Tax=Novosphingobium sp. KCTC 2891 TaxID=2989730 RepID=UPI0022236329|nr:carboxypeptidase-like regulatory domain-containing protein [Novosphingobium sp. KCTC 2891]MCW1383708.1 carboxypeptidase-like regulatory domain-containing protein [Novosphingobium sp. KCTC 2891]